MMYVYSTLGCEIFIELGKWPSHLSMDDQIKQTNLGGLIELQMCWENTVIKCRPVQFENQLNCAWLPM